MYRKQLQNQGLSIERHSSMPEMTRDEFLEKMKENTTSLKRNNSLSNVSTLPKRIIKTKVSSRLLQGTAASQGKKKEKVSYVPINKKPDPTWTVHPIGNVDSGYQTQTFVRYYDFEKQKSFHYSDSEKEDREEIITFEAHNHKTFNSYLSDNSIEKKKPTKEKSQSLPKQTLVNESKYSKQSSVSSSLPEKKNNIISESSSSKTHQVDNNFTYFDPKISSDKEINIHSQDLKEQRSKDMEELPNRLFQKYKDGKLLQNVDSYKNNPQETPDLKNREPSNKEEKFSNIFSKINYSNQEQISVDFSRRTFTTLSSGTFDSNTFKYIYTVDAELSYKEYNKLLSMINLLQGQKRKSEEEVQELKEKFEKTGKEKMQLAHNNHILRQSLDAANRAIKEINDKVSELKQTLVPLRQDNTQLRKDNDLLKAEKIQIQKEVNELKVHTEVSKNEKLVMTNEIQDLKSLKNSAEEKLLQQSRENETYKNSMHEKFKKLEEAYRNYCLDMEKKLTQSSKEVDSLRELNESIKSETDSFKKENEFMKEINGGLVKTNQKLHNEISQIKEAHFSSEKISKSESLEAQKLQIKELSEEIVRQKEKAQKFKSSCNILQVEIDMLKKEIIITENNRKDLEAKYEMIFNLRKIEEQQTEILKEEAEELKKKLSSLNKIRDEKEVLHKEKQTYQDQFEIMRKETEELRRLCSECNTHVEENSLLRCELEKFKSLLCDFEELKKIKMNDDNEKVKLIGELQNLREQLRILEEKQKSISSPYNNEIKVELENLRQQMKDLGELNERRKIEIHTGEIKAELENLRLQFKEMNRPNQSMETKDENNNNEKNKHLLKETVSVNKNHLYEKSRCKDQTKYIDQNKEHQHSKENKYIDQNKEHQHSQENKYIDQNKKHQHSQENKHIDQNKEHQNSQENKYIDQNKEHQHSQEKVSFLEDKTKLNLMHINITDSNVKIKSLNHNNKHVKPIVVENEVYSMIENEQTNEPDQQFSDYEETEKMLVFLPNENEIKFRQNSSIHQKTNDQEKTNIFTNKELCKNDFLNEEEIYLHQHKNEEFRNIQTVVQSATQTVIQPTTQAATQAAKQAAKQATIQAATQAATQAGAQATTQAVTQDATPAIIHQAAQLENAQWSTKNCIYNEENYRRTELQHLNNETMETTRTNFLNESDLRYQNRSKNDCSKESFSHKQSNMSFQQNNNLAKKHIGDELSQYGNEVLNNQDTNHTEDRRRYQDEFCKEEDKFPQNISPLYYTQENSSSLKNIEFYEGDNIFHQVLFIDNKTKRQVTNERDNKTTIERDKSNKALINDEEIQRIQITNNYVENQKMHETVYNNDEEKQRHSGGKNINEDMQKMQGAGENIYEENQRVCINDRIKYKENHRTQEETDNKYKENQKMSVINESRHRENNKMYMSGTNKYEEEDRQKKHLQEEKTYKQTQRMQLMGENINKGNQIGEMTSQTTETKKYEESYRIQREDENKENKRLNMTGESKEKRETQVTSKNKYEDHLHVTSEVKHQENERVHLTNSKNYETRQKMSTADERKYANKRIHVEDEINEELQVLQVEGENLHSDNEWMEKNKYDEMQRKMVDNRNYEKNNRINKKGENKYENNQQMHLKSERQENKRQYQESERQYHESERQYRESERQYQENERQYKDGERQNQENKSTNVIGTNKHKEIQRVLPNIENENNYTNQRIQEKNENKYEDRQKIQVTDVNKCEEKKLIQTCQNIYEENHKKLLIDKKYEKNTNNDFAISQRDVETFANSAERIESGRNQNINKYNSSLNSAFVSDESSIRGSLKASNQDIFLKVPSLSHKNNLNSYKEETKSNTVQFVIEDNNKVNALNLGMEQRQNPHTSYSSTNSSKKQDYVSQELAESKKYKHETMSLDRRRNIQDNEVNSSRTNNFSYRTETQKSEKIEREDQTKEIKNQEHINEIINFELNQRLHNSQVHLYNKTNNESKQTIDSYVFGNKKSQANTLENTLRQEEKVYFSNTSLQQKNELSDASNLNTIRGRSPVRREHKKNKSVGSLASSEFTLNTKQQSVPNHQEELEIKNKRLDAETQLQKRRRLSEERRKKRRSNDGESSSDENISRQREPRKTSRNKGTPAVVETNNGSDFLTEAMKSRQEKAFLHKIKGSHNSDRENSAEATYLENSEERTKKSLKNKIRKQLVDGIKKNSNWNSFSDSETRTMNLTTTHTEHRTDQNNSVTSKAIINKSMDLNNGSSFHKNANEAKSYDNREHFQKVGKSSLLNINTENRNNIAETDSREIIEVLGQNSYKADRFLPTNKKFEHAKQDNEIDLQTSNHSAKGVPGKPIGQSGSLQMNYMENNKKQTNINNSSFERNVEEHNITNRYTSHEETSYATSQTDRKYNVNQKGHSNGSLKQSKGTFVSNQYNQDETYQVYRNSPQILQKNQSNYSEKNKLIESQQSSQFHKSHTTSEKISKKNVQQNEHIKDGMYATVEKKSLITKQYSEAELEQMERMERARIKLLLSKGETDSPIIVKKFNSSSVKSSSLENVITKEGVPLSRLNKIEQNEYERNLASNKFMKSNSEYELLATHQKYETLPKKSGKKSKGGTVTRSSTLPRNTKTQVISQEFHTTSSDILINSENTYKNKSRSYRDMKMDVDLFHKKSGSNLISNRQNFMSNDSLGGYSQITYTTVSDKDYEERYDDFATQLDGSIYMHKNHDSKNVDESELLRHAKHIPKGHSKFRCEKCRALNATNRTDGAIHFCWERYFPISESTPAQSAMSLNRI